MDSTLNSIYANFSFALRNHMNAIADLQEQAATGSRINRSSDAPNDGYQVLQLASEKRSIDSYLDNINNLSSILEHASTLVTQIQGSLSDVRVQVTQITNGVYSEESRERAAESINNVIESVATMVNSSHLNEYIFGGHASTTAPYAITRTDGRITDVTYQGSTETRMTQVAEGVRSSAFLVGQDIFSSSEPSSATFEGITGVAAGTGTSTVDGYAWLTVTDLGGGSYSLSIDDGASSVVADGSTNQAVTNSETGEILYVDSSSITAEGTELVTVSGSHSIFTTLLTLRDIFENERNLSTERLIDIQSSTTDAVTELQELLNTTSVTVGSRLGFLEDLKNNLQELRYNAEDEQTMIEQADISQIAIDLAKRETLYEMSLSIAGKISNISLLNYL